MKKKLMTLLMILGVCVLLYPLILDIYYEQQQKKLLEDWEQININIENEILQNDSSDLLWGQELEMQELIKSTDELSIAEENERIERKKKIEREAREKYMKANMEGTLKIEKINLYQPILSGATQRNLDISISSVKKTGRPGEEGNYVIAGHRSHTYGRNFNRLDEVTIGDIIEVENGEQIFRYQVDEKFLVEPKETWVLKGRRGVKEITLITCDPMINPNKRLIVKGKILE